MRIGRDDLELERLAVEIDVARGAQGDLEPADRQHDRGRRRHVVLRQSSGQRERLLLRESLGGKLEMILARGVGRAVENAAVGKIDLDRPARDRCSILVSRDQISLDRLAAVEHGLLQVEAQVDGLELIRVDLKRAGEVALAGLVNPHSISAHGRRRVERQGFVKRAEFRERDRAGHDQPPAAVGDLEAVDRPGARWRTGRSRPRGPRRGSRPSVRADRPAGRCRCRHAE